MGSKEAGAMPQRTYSRAMTQMSARGWRRAEPGYLGEPEQPRLIRQALEMLETVGVSFDEIAAAGGLPSERIRRMIFEDRPKVTLATVRSAR